MNRLYSKTIDRQTSMAKVSIIIPCYNDGIYLMETVDSALAQTYKDLEIIIVDDKSDQPGTLEVLDRLSQHKNLKVLLNNGSKGAAGARNFAIANSSGEYILPLDADDKFHPAYSAKAVEVLETRPEVGICYCEAAFFGLKRGKWQLPTFSVQKILLGNMIFASAMFRRNLWDRAGGYDETVPHLPEDYLLWLAMLELGVSVFQIPEILFYYRIRQNSRTVKILSSVQSQQLVPLGIFNMRRGLYEKNLHLLFRSAVELYQEKEANERLLTYHLGKIFFTAESNLRLLLKKFLGRR